MISDKDNTAKLAEAFKDISTKALTTINKYDVEIARLKDIYGPENEKVIAAERSLELAKIFAAEAVKVELSLANDAHRLNPELAKPSFN